VNEPSRVAAYGGPATSSFVLLNFVIFVPFVASHSWCSSPASGDRAWDVAGL